MAIKIPGMRLAPSDVFTPRSHDLNEKTYAKRPELERRLKNALSGHKFIIIHGESGNGKTWLYKNVFEETGTPYSVINLAKMNIEKSLNAVILSKLGEFQATQQVKETQDVDAGIKPMGVGASYKHQFEYKTHAVGALELLCNELNAQFKNKRCVLVLDNFEQIIDNNEYVKEIASLIISADEEFISRNKVKIAIVGTPSNIRQMIEKSSNALTISNRFIEIPEVARLELGEARHIMEQGFISHLKLTMLVDKNDLYKAISFKTDRIAQHVQELCLKIAEFAERDGQRINEKIVEHAEQEWLEETLSADCAVIDSLMNSQETKVGRKNQVMYCLGQIVKEEFKHNEIENMVRKTFKVDPFINLNIPQILAEFSKADNPIIKRLNNRSGYRFCSPKHRMAIRSRLKLFEDKVVKV